MCNLKDNLTQERRKWFRVISSSHTIRAGTVASLGYLLLGLNPELGAPLHLTIENVSHL